MIDDGASVSRSVGYAAVAAAVLGLFSTAGDWIWARYIPDGSVLPGVVHGVVIFVLLALVLGWAAGSGRSLRRLLISLPAAGLGIAAGFYPLAHLLGYLASLLVSWVAMWLSLALLQRWADDRLGTLRGAVARGLLAAVGSGLAFWAVSGMWTDPAGHTRYLLRLGFWTFAFLPGFLALLAVRRMGRRDPRSGPTQPP